MARYIFSDSYAATVLPIIREIHREILARKPPGAISNRAIDRAIARAVARHGPIRFRAELKHSPGTSHFLGGFQSED
jgi:hypothetical protein